jgi:hypothetical protein
VTSIRKKAVSTDLTAANIATIIGLLAETPAKLAAYSLYLRPFSLY